MNLPNNAIATRFIQLEQTSTSDTFLYGPPIGASGVITSICGATEGLLAYEHNAYVYLISGAFPGVRNLIWGGLNPLGLQKTIPWNFGFFTGADLFVPFTPDDQIVATINQNMDSSANGWLTVAGYLYEDFRFDPGS
jgi:hypothetical protein